MLLVMQILVPMVCAALCLPLWGRARPQAGIAISGSAVALACSVLLLLDVREHGIRVVEVSGWAAPFGITLVADLFGSIMALLGSIVGFTACVYSAGSIDPVRGARGHYPLTLTLLASVAGAFLTGDLFNLYVWYELMLLSSFVLLTLGGSRGQVEGGIKYVTLNLISSAVFLSAVGLIYGVTGTLNMAHLAVRLDQVEPAVATAMGALLLVSFGIKAAVFPFFFWLPASYHTPPAAVSALFAGLLTKVGVYSVLRALTLMWDQEWGVMGPAVLVVAALTMATGVLGAVAQNEMRRILSFHIVSQIGYMLMGLGVAMVAVDAAQDRGVEGAVPEAAIVALTGSVFYILHHIIVKTNLFFAAGAVLAVRGTGELKELGGLARTHKLLAGLFLLSALSLAGIPIFSGFWAKLTLVLGGMRAETWGIVAVSLAVSVLTLFSMTKIWSEVFWKATPEGVGAKRVPALMLWPMVGLACVTVAIGFGARPAYGLASDAARSMLDPSAYVRAVLGEGAWDGGSGSEARAGARPAEPDGEAQAVGTAGVACVLTAEVGR